MTPLVPDVLPSRLLNLVADHERHFWAGDNPPFPFANALIWGSTNFRLSAGHHQQYDAVWYYEKRLSDLDPGQYPLILDELLRLIGKRGFLVVRYGQNSNFSNVALKHFLGRRYGFQVRVEWESLEEDEFTTVFEVERQCLERYRDPSWTFAILTQGKRKAGVIRFLESVRQHDPQRAHEILVCGPPAEEYEPFAVRYLAGEYREEYAEISRKKNDIAAAATGANLCIVHDRYVLNEDFFAGFSQFGYDFDFATVPQRYENGTPFPAYCALESNSMIWSSRTHCTDYNRVRDSQYVNGGLIIAKTQTLRDVRFNELLFWNQAEDVELSRAFRDQSLPPRVNAFASATTIGITPEYTRGFRRERVGPDCSVSIPFVRGRPLDRIRRGVKRVLELSERPFLFREAGMAWPDIIRLGKKFILREGRRLAHRAVRHPSAESLRRQGRRLSAMRHRLRRVLRPDRNPAVRPPLAEGVNVLLYTRHGSGVLNITCHLIRTLVAQDVPVCIVALEGGAPRLDDFSDLQRFAADAPRYKTNLWSVGFPFLADHYSQFGDWFDDHWNINLTHWELPFVPERLAHHFSCVQEVFVNSEFNRDAIAGATTKPVTLIDPQVAFAADYGRTFDRAWFGLPEGKTLFLLNWEFTSSTVRKCPEAAIDAFQRAFGDDDQVGLVLHVKFDRQHGAAWQKKYEAFIAEMKSRCPRMTIVRRGVLSYEEAIGLKRACDCTVSLHRSEGYGMACAESLAVGRPCIMTGWSGNRELTKNPAWQEQIFEVEASIVPVSAADYPWVAAGEEAFQFWANPSVDDAATQMRNVADRIRRQKRELPSGGIARSKDLQYVGSTEVTTRRGGV